ncbi:MAG TPA: hypothetical protein VF315_06415 [Steroidobacteraceae bacterium]
MTTPLGVVWGVIEAYRFHWWLAVLMAAMVSVLGAFMLMTVLCIRAESQAPPPRSHGLGHGRP